MIMDLSKLTDEQLREEVQRREREQRYARRPSLRFDPDYTGLIQYLERCTDEITEGRLPTNFEHGVFREAVNAVYGTYYFEWLHKQEISSCM